MEEAPLDALRSRGSDYQTGLAYNVEACKKNEFLVTCFRAPYDDVRDMMLTHKHMTLVVRAFLSHAKWDLPQNLEKRIRFCDDMSLSLIHI